MVREGWMYGLCSLHLSAVRRQSGASLVISLLILVVLLLLSTSAVHLALQGQKASRNDYDRHVARNAAEAGLADAERDIEGDLNRSASRARVFAVNNPDGFVQGCARGMDNPYLGLCAVDEEGLPVWRSVDLLDASGLAPTVPYGRFTGRYFQAGEGPLPAKVPRYIIEIIPDRRPGMAASIGHLRYVYRITAIGFGTSETTQVVLQSIYRKEG